MYMDKEVRMYAPEPIFSFKSWQKQSSYLVKAKLYPINRPVGSFKCNHPLQSVCKCYWDWHFYQHSDQKKKTI